MLYFESDKLKTRVVDVEEKYFEHFQEDFPIFEVLSEMPTADEVEKLEKSVADCISNDKPYPKSDDYADKLY
ncbi:hypothetical protein [Streptococcus equinus]|uniref:hypothetical protein n=1 Tax=Streptococcus equinus TaxID=1335 RepID=UPI0008811108|nr:hypothetical protein [Streptococcus equinus]QBX24704.1 hypothetical protein Javan202_0025 [Streptococcus phage Javan202]SDQ66713.1 hypothetical protein SAMN04488495_1788 [Streptococcus equinus]SEN67592.1 hypothetical protein SAMN04488496_0876 [Streptococcus equinus]